MMVALPIQLNCVPVRDAQEIKGDLPVPLCTGMPHWVTSTKRPTFTGAS